MKSIYIGAAYYPEMWAESEVDRDIEKMKRLGVNCMRVGEFAWGKMEPREGEFCFEWLKTVVDKLYKNGIYTVMCTPTCTPPRWMLDTYEEMRSIDSRGVRAEVSSRCHPCKTSPKMREKNARIVEEMAKVFAAHPGIIGWQIDNEIFLTAADAIARFVKAHSAIICGSGTALSKLSTKSGAWCAGRSNTVRLKMCSLRAKGSGCILL